LLVFCNSFNLKIDISVYIYEVVELTESFASLSCLCIQQTNKNSTPFPKIFKAQRSYNPQRTPTIDSTERIRSASSCNIFLHLN